MLKKQIIIIFLFSVILTFLLSGCKEKSELNNAENGDNIIALSNGWEYLSGDSPFDSLGIPLWTYASGLSWKPIARPMIDTSLNNGYENVWFKAKIPNGNWAEPCIYFRYANIAFDMYIGDKLIYKSGEIKNNGKGRYNAWSYFYITFNKQDIGKNLYFRFYNSRLSSYIGIVSNVELGSYSDFIMRTIRSECIPFTFPILYFILAIFFLIIYFVEKNDLIYLYVFITLVGEFTITVTDGGFYGLIMGSNQSMAEIYIQYVISYFSTTCGVFLLCHYLLTSVKLKLLMKISVVVYSTYAIVTFLIAILEIVKIHYFIAFFDTYLSPLVLILVLFSVSLNFAKTKDVYLKLFGIGVLCATIAGVHDIMMVKGTIKSNIMLMKYGTMAMVVSMLFVSILKYVSVNKKIKLYKDAEIKALQSQINRHFMYNFLENIRMMAEIDNNLEIRDSIKTFSNLIRYNMDIKHQVVSLKEEMEYICNYIELINMQYDRKIQFKIKSKIKYLDDIKIPKMLLQPIIENAIEHGIMFLENHRTIYVDIEKKDDLVRIEILDNGKGIEADILKIIKQRITNTYKPDKEAYDSDDSKIKENNISIRREKGIGLKNINERIEFFYGKGFDIEIDSQINKYTKVTVKIPMINLK